MEAMDLLKFALTSPPALVLLNYTEGVVDIILAVNASLEGWGGVLMQLVKGKRHLSRYKSGIWSSAEKKYDATKRKCQGVLKALKKSKILAIRSKICLKNRCKSLSCTVKLIKDGSAWNLSYLMNSMDSVI